MKYGFQTKAASQFPPMVILDVTNTCNMRCIHCPHKEMVKAAGYQAKFMSEDVFKKVIDEVAGSSAELLRIASDGESLLHPKIVEFLSYAKSKISCPVNLTTNGMLMDEAMTRQLLEMELDVIDVSIDAFSDDTYKKVRVGGEYAVVKENTERLINLNQQLGGKTKVMVSIIDQPITHHEVKSFESYWSPMVDLVLVRKLNDCLGMVETDGVKVSTERWPCTQLWKRVTINCDGEIRFCVEDWLNKSIVGNIRNSSIREIWASSEYEQLRQAHLDGSYGKCTICENCVDWHNSSWDFGYDHALQRVYNKSGKE